VKIVKRGGDKSQLELTLREGRNRQVRRMLARLGHKVRDLTRIKMGPLTLKGLGPGEFRPLTSRELRELRDMAQSRAKRHDERVQGDDHEGSEEAE
jgi:16S rRNA U516 pseudouridylate synthase RsuA-like enzyme